jgi:electron transfer flavoprotein beta subunit
VRILSIIRHVPDSFATIKVSPDGKDIDTTGIKFVCDPFDEFGVEQAIQLREKRSDVKETVVMAIGPDRAKEALWTSMGMGIEKAVHVCDPAFESRSELFLAEVLAAAIRRDPTGFDLILCGKQSIDNDAGELGPALAECLDLPHVGAVTQLEVADDGKRFTARRRIEGADEVVECTLPALITCEKGLVEPRYPPLPKLMKAKKNPIEKLTAAELTGLDASAAGGTLELLEPPAPRPPCKIVDGEPPEMAKELVRLLREEAKVV